MYLFDKLYNCGIFQGQGRVKHYFEGWYYKHVDKDEKNILSIIPGVSYEDSREKSHAFIQIIDGEKHQTHYISYPIGDFRYSKKTFLIEIGRNVFSDKGINLNIDEKDINIHGSLSYHERVPWHSSLMSPNSMGWYGFIPVMECYHGVLSMHHSISGSIAINGNEMCFDSGKGYMEKDWGTSFPSSWIWLQSNHFDSEEISFMLSVAKIPWHGKSFTGFIVGLWCKGILYRFATYTGAKLEGLKYLNGQIEMQIADRSYRLIIKACQGHTGNLQAPVKGAMVGSVQESINARMDILLVDKKTRQSLLRESARCCGMEVAGNIQELVSLP